MKSRIVNLFAGPGTGKSTTAAALFAELKYRGVNCEYVQEYAKDATWEKRGHKLFRAQEYIFGKQHFRISRTADEVDVIITDSPVLMGLVYVTPDYLPSLKHTIREAFDQYDNLNVFLKRAPFDVKKYNPKGRNQSAEEALVKDGEILKLLNDSGVEFIELEFNRTCPEQIIELMIKRGWDVPTA